MENVEYDFSQFDERKTPQVSTAIRTELLDNATEVFIKNHPQAIIINIGCGLDTRFSRLDNGKIHWYDLDLPEAVKVRKQFFNETNRYKMIAKSVFDYSWINDIKTTHPILIIAEGILMYFEENKVRNLISTMGESFVEPEMLLEITSSAVVERNKKHKNIFQRNAPFNWGIKNINEIEKFDKQIKVLDELNYLIIIKIEGKKLT